MTVGTVTVTVTTGVATGTVAGVPTGTVVGVATGSAGTDATTLPTVSAGELDAAEATGDSCVVGAVAARGVSEG